jgi:hypothetical protein
VVGRSQYYSETQGSNAARLFWKYGAELGQVPITHLSSNPKNENEK